ncbi:MAG: transposase [Saprospiraceae bacterium]|nr:transposase [Saprospiraceae bacterium]
MESQTNPIKLNISWTQLMCMQGIKLSSIRYRKRHIIGDKYLSVMNTIKEFLDKNVESILPASAIGKAFGYAIKRWDKLLAYTVHGEVEIDNNLIENTIRPLALGRKNYLFAGSEEFAQR